MEVLINAHENLRNYKISAVGLFLEEIKFYLHISNFFPTFTIMLYKLCLAIFESFPFRKLSGFSSRMIIF